MLGLAALGVMMAGISAWAEDKADAKEGAAIQKQAEAFIAAFEKGDARGVAALWSDYTDLVGRRLKGRAAIEKEFAGFFAAHKGLKVRILSESLTMLKPDVAVEEGITEVFVPDGSPPSRARYRNVLVKKDGVWLLGSVKDTPFAPPGNRTHLLPLQGLLGQWAGAREGGEVERIALGWNETGNFVTGRFSTTVRDISVGSARQVIGWDPAAKRIRSWSFDDTGAFGEGVWSRDGDRWVVKSVVTLADGQKETATFVVRPAGDDALIVEVKERTVGGQPLPDAKPVKLTRVK